MMASPHHIAPLLVLLITSAPSLILGQHQPYFFNYQPQQQPFQQGTYQPFTNSPFYQPSYETHTPGGGGEGNPNLLNNFFGGDFGQTPTPAASPLVTYPTQVTTLRGNAPQTSTSAGGTHFQPQQPTFHQIGNSIAQQTPTTTTNAVGNTSPVNNVFRPSSPFVNNHHTHIVNGLPRQQFFGNNYDFFRERHGLTHLPTTSGPFLHNTLSSSPNSGLFQHQPSPTPSAISTSAAPTPAAASSSASSAKANEPAKANAVQQPSRAPPTPQSTFFQPFPGFNGPSQFSPDSSQSTKPTLSSNQNQQTIKTNPVVASVQSPQPTQSSVSPSFAFSQFFPEKDTIDNNELSRQPLFEEDDGEDDVDTYNGNNSGNNVYQQDNRAQVVPQSAPPVAPSAASPSATFKSQQKFGNSVNSFASNQAKDEPAPIRIHNTTPIRIVFNYEQAVEALEKNPGIRVVVAQTEKNNLTEEESTSSPIGTTARSVSSTTTPRPGEYVPSSNFGTYRPAIVSTTARPTAPPPAPTSRYEYQTVNNPYTQRTTAAALENLALELEGRFDPTGRPGLSSGRPLYETVATLATEEPPTPSPIKTISRGSKKYVVIPKAANDNVYKAPEPRVVVNDLASIVVQTLAPSGTPSYASPTQPTYQPQEYYTSPQPTYQPQQRLTSPQPTNQQRYTFPPYQEKGVRQQVEEDLEQEIENLSQQLKQEFQTTIQTTTTTTSTTTTTPPPPPPRTRVTPRIRATTYRPSTYRPSTYRTTPRPPPPPPTEVQEPQQEEIITNNLGNDEPPTQSARSQPPRFYYNDRPHGGLPGAYQRYEYNGADVPIPAPPQKKPRRRLLRQRGRLVAGSPPRPVQVSPGPEHFGPVIGPEGIPPQFQFGPGGPLPLNAQGSSLPVPAGAPVPGPVFRVGPRGRLLRRKTRPRTQGPQEQQATPGVVRDARPAPLPSPSSASPSPSAFPDLPPVPQELSPEGPSHAPPPPPLYSPTPFIPNEVPLVTTFRPGPPPNLVVQQSLAGEGEDDRIGGGPDKPFRSRFRFSPRPTTPGLRATTSSRIVDENDDEEGASNQFESEEEAPSPPQRRRPQFSTTTTTSTEKPETSQVAGDRANILQRQIRFRNRQKNNPKN